MKSTTPPASVALDKVLDAESILRLQDIVPRVPTAPHVYEFALKLIRSSRPDNPEAPAYVRECVSWGAGPRAAQNLTLGSRARALLRGRCHVTIEDVEETAMPVLAHRIVTNFNADSEGVTVEQIIERLLRSVPEPGEKDYR